MTPADGPVAWSPRTIEELKCALAGGLLVEGHHLDFKRELAAGRSANRALAKDLAAFAVDGGRIIFGVDEGEHLAVVPIDLAGLKERVDQVARSLVAPPLAVRCIELPLEDDPTRGCLVVVVPPSPQAPHQVVERIWGRGDTTNHVMAPAEIAAVYERRERERVRIDQLLDDEIARDPTPADLRAQGHLFVVAQPEGADGELFLRALGSQSFSGWFTTTLEPKLLPADWGLTIRAGNFSRRARGWASHSYCISEERTVRPNGEQPARETKLLDLEVLEGGGVRLFCGRATGSNDEQRYFVDPLVVGLTRQVVEVALAVAESAGFVGSWQLGLALTNLRGAVSAVASKDFRRHPTGFSQDSFRRTFTVTYEQLVDVVAVAEELTAALLRGFQSPYGRDSR